jgi:glyoxylase-like metal-dependent hydrolase (beta-lactamase superfamily II)
MKSSTRRTWLAALLVGACVSVAKTTDAQTESPVIKINEAAAKTDITTTPLRGGVSALMGSGGNIAVLTEPDGKFLVDGGIAISKDKIQKALAGLGSGSPKYLVNTHWHWDHTDGNPWLHDAGATIIGHSKTLEHLSTTVRVDDWNYTFQPLPAAGRPTILVDSEKTMDFDGETILIRAYKASHTDGDLSVYFKKADVLATGDTFWNGYYPFIDYVEGGGIDGMIEAANTNVAMTTDKTIIVPGHGPVADRRQLVAFRDMLVAIRKNVADLKAKGLTVDQVIAAKPTSAFDATWGQYVINPAFFTQLVYRGL